MQNDVGEWWENRKLGEEAGPRNCLDNVDVIFHLLRGVGASCINRRKDTPCLLSLELMLLLFICLRDFLLLDYYYYHTTLYIIGDENAYAHSSVIERSCDEDTATI